MESQVHQLILERVKENELEPFNKDHVTVKQALAAIAAKLIGLWPMATVSMEAGLPAALGLSQSGPWLAVPLGQRLAATALGGAAKALGAKPLGAVATAASSVGVGVAAAAGPIASLVLGLSHIGEMNQIGKELAERNAWKTGFASTLAALAEAHDWAPPNMSGLGLCQMRGRNAAVSFIKGLGAQRGIIFLKRYEGHHGKDQALKDIGGYRV